MSATAALAASNEAYAPSFDLGYQETVLRGKIMSRREHEDTFYTTMRLPSPDEWTGPQTVEVASQKKFGQVDSIVSIKCQTGGYNRTFNTKENGRGSRIHNTYRFIEEVRDRG